MTPIAIIKEHPELVEIDKRGDEQTMFLKKKLENLLEEKKAFHKSYWEEIEGYMLKADLHTHPKDCNFQIKDGVLYEKGKKDDGDDGLPSFIKHILKSLT